MAGGEEYLTFSHCTGDKICTIYTVQGIYIALHNLHSTEYTSCTVCTIRPIHNLQFTIYTVQMMYAVQFTLY